MELLANNYRPKCLKDVIGQEHLIGNNKILSNLVKNKKLFSLLVKTFLLAFLKSVL